MTSERTGCMNNSFFFLNGREKTKCFCMANTASVCKQIEIDCTYDTESMQKYQVPVTYLYNITGNKHLGGRAGS